MRRAPSVYTPATLTSYLRNVQVCKEVQVGQWRAVRPEGMYSIKSRFCLAWEVFTGRADVLRWPNQ